MKKVRHKAYEVTAWACDIAARHEFGSTDVTVYPTKRAMLRDNHGTKKGCDGAVKLTITYKLPTLARGQR